MKNVRRYKSQQLLKCNDKAVQSAEHHMLVSIEEVRLSGKFLPLPSKSSSYVQHRNFEHHVAHFLPGNADSCFYVIYLISTSFPETESNPCY